MAEKNMESNKIKVFYSYSHADEDFRKSLETHLTILRRKGFISEWHDRKIIPGSEWESEIDSNLANSDLILLLISPDFIASEYCYSVEMDRAMEMHESRKAIVVPIYVRPTEVSDEPFSRIQSLPTDKKPIPLWDNADLAWIDVVKGLKRTINEIQDRSKRSSKSDNRLKDIRSLLTEEIERMDAVIESDVDECSGIATGFDRLDNVVDGFHGSDLWVVAARPQMGKTDFVLNILANVVLGKNIPVAFFSLQLASNKLIRRLMSSIGRVDSHYQLRGHLTDQDWPRLTSVVHMLIEAESHLFINDKPEITINELSDSVRELQSKHGIGLLILDGLQNVVLSADTNKVEVETISRNLKRLARDLKLPIIATLPVSREVERRADKRPLLSDLGKWDNLQNDADVILFIYRDELYDPSTYDRGTAEILVAKNNNGPIGRVRLTYLEKYCKFENYVPEIYDSMSANEDNPL